MKIEQTAFGPWKGAWRLEHEGVEMIVVTEVGPRILSLRLAGEDNILFDDSRGSLTRGDWNIWGGHRFWVAPESESTYEADNAPCTVEVGGDCLRATGRPEKSGLEKTLEIAPRPGRGGFTIRHILRNTSPMVQPGAIWALTCVAPRGRVVIPWGEGTAGWRTQMVRYWAAWGGHASDVASRQWQPLAGRFVVDPTGEEGKVGVFSDGGRLCLLRPDATFVKACIPVAEGPYPDGGCNIELYTCARFVELETLSPLRTFLPGGQYEHTEYWLLSPRTFQSKEWAAAAGLID
ncbi:MAG: hypothetical protein M1457_04975 [bacterium]|nr:hypothetical protein [bacterium]